MTLMVLGTLNNCTYQPFVPGINDCIEHGLIEEAVAHPLWYDDVYSLHWQLHLFHLSLDDGHNWRHKKVSRITSHISFSGSHVKVHMCHHLVWFYLLTVIKLVGLHNFHSVVWDAAALDLLRQRQTTTDFTIPIYASIIKKALSLVNWTNYWSNYKVQIISKTTDYLWHGATLTPITFLAPALAANMQRMPVPLPTSSTTLSLNRCLLWNMELRYVRVRTSSFNISYSGSSRGPIIAEGLKTCDTKIHNLIQIDHLNMKALRFA